jgi:hypothetical protein
LPRRARARSKAFSSRSRLTGFKQIIQRPGLKRADGVLVVRRDNHHNRQRALRQMADHVEAAHPGHLQVEENQVGLQARDLAQSVVAVGRLAGDFDVRERPQFVAQHLARDGFIVHHQRAYRRGVHLPGSNAKTARSVWKTHR